MGKSDNREKGQAWHWHRVARQGALLRGTTEYERALRAVAWLQVPGVGAKVPPSRWRPVQCSEPSEWHSHWQWTGSQPASASLGGPHLSAALLARKGGHPRIGPAFGARPNLEWRWMTEILVQAVAGG